MIRCPSGRRLRGAPLAVSLLAALTAGIASAQAPAPAPATSEAPGGGALNHVLCTGQSLSTGTGGRPGKLYRFRREILL